MLKKSFVSILFTMLVGCGGGDAPNELQRPGVVVSKAPIQKRLLWSDPSVGLIRQLAPNPNGESVYVLGYQRSCEVSLSGQTVRYASDSELGAPVLVEKKGNLPPLNNGAIIADFDEDGSPDSLTSPLENQFKILSAGGGVLGETTLDGDYWFEPVSPEPLRITC